MSLDDLPVAGIVELQREKETCLRVPRAAALSDSISAKNGVDVDNVQRP